MECLECLECLSPSHLRGAYRSLRLGDYQMECPQGLSLLFLKTDLLWDYHLGCHLGWVNQVETPECDSRMVVNGSEGLGWKFMFICEAFWEYHGKELKERGQSNATYCCKIEIPSCYMSMSCLSSSRPFWFRKTRLCLGLRSKLCL